MFEYFNDGLSNIFSQININFDRCNSSLYDFCETDSIEDFLSDFVIQIYSYNEQIDFKKYGQKPTSKEQYYLGSIYPFFNNVNNTVLQGFYINLRYNQIQT